MNLEYERLKALQAQLKEKTDACFQEYKTRWLSMTPAQLIEQAEELEAVTRMAREMPLAVNAEEAEYLLKFQNPLEVVSDAWIVENGIGSLIIDEDLHHILWDLVDKQDAEQYYEMEPEGQDNAMLPEMSL